MKTLLKQLKSHLLLGALFLDRLYDNAHRVIAGLPRLRRCQITANLFLGSQYNKLGLQKLKSLGITAIVNMREHSVYGDSLYLGIKYLHLATVDNTPPAIETLITGADFIDNEIKNGGKVYVHCRQGLGRGPTMTLAYLLKTGLTYDDAFMLVKKVRPFINPRSSQVDRLRELEAYYKTHTAT
jgi:dual specificity MAP kinase phosphatase